MSAFDGVRRVVFAHAHPDDETLATGALIQHLTRSGVAVAVVTATRGELGAVVPGPLSALEGTPELEPHRVGELTAALRALGAEGPYFLGDPPARAIGLAPRRYTDSGMRWITPTVAGPGDEAGPDAFTAAEVAQAAADLAAFVRFWRADLVVSYESDGGYGHPDHVQAHRVTTAAVAASAGDGHPGEPWQVPKFYWTVMDGESMAEALESINEVELPDSWVRIPASALPFDLGHRIDAVIDAQDSLPAKVAAMRAHQTQVTVEPSGRVFALSNNIALPISPVEHYLLVDGAAGQRDDRGVETDLLSGINLA